MRYFKMLHKRMQLHNITVVIIVKGMSEVRNNNYKTKETEKERGHHEHL